VSCFPAAMERFEGHVFTALCCVNLLVSCLVFSTTTRELREPYMDELFHVPQAQKYCHGTFREVTTTHARAHIHTHTHIYTHIPVNPLIVAGAFIYLAAKSPRPLL